MKIKEVKSEKRSLARGFELSLKQWSDEMVKFNLHRFCWFRLVETRCCCVRRLGLSVGILEGRWF